MIADSLLSLVRPIESVSRDTENARTRNSSALKGIMDSLERFGQQKPIVITPKGVILAGNGTHEAAQALGWKEIAVTVFNPPDRDGSGKREDRAYALADNSTAERADWDWDVLTEQLKVLDGEGFDLSLIGFHEEDTAPLFADGFDPDKYSDDDPPAPRKSVSFSAEQFEIIYAAVERLRDVADDKSIGEGRALELICAEYISGT